MHYIHKTAIIEKGATLGSNITIGPYCVIGKDVILGNNNELKSHVVIDGNTEIGDNNIIYPFASIGHTPQDLKYRGERSKVIIGNNNIIREYVTIHLGTLNGGRITKVGNNCLLMLGTHIAHDCIVGDFVIFANNATLGGHVLVEDYVSIGGLAAVHQWVRIGAYSIIGGVSAVVRDVIPFGMVLGDRAYLEGVNLTGMNRRGFTKNEIIATKEAVDILFCNISNSSWDERKLLLSKKFIGLKPVEVINDFISKESKRFYCNYKKK